MLAEARLAREPARGPRLAAQGAQAQAVAGPEPPRAPRGLDLAHDQRVAVQEREVDLGQGRPQAPGQDPEAARGEEARRDALAREPELAVRRLEPRRGERRREAEGETAQLRGRGRQDAAPGSFAPAVSGSSVRMVWTATRLKRMRTPSATCSVTTSFWTMATVP